MGEVVANPTSFSDPEGVTAGAIPLQSENSNGDPEAVGEKSKGLMAGERLSAGLAGAGSG